MSVQQQTASPIAASYTEAVISNPAVCSNCLRIVREQREQPAPDAGKLTTKTARSSTSELTRVQPTTELDHTPGGAPTDSHVTWCECGVESAFQQEREDRADPETHQVLLRRLLEVCEEQGITVNRQRLAERALQLARDTVGPDHRYGDVGHADCTFCAHDVMTTDEILAEALEYGIQTAP